MRDAETLHDVLGLDARPHDDAHFCQTGAYIGEFDRQPPLRGIELRRPFEQHRALRVEHGEFVRPVRHPPVTSRIANRDHNDLLG